MCRVDTLIYIWRKQVRNGEMAGVAMTESGIAAFARIAIAAPQAGASVAPAAGSEPDVPSPSKRGNPERRRAGSIEVRLTNGRSLKADETIAPDILARLVTALDGDGA